MTFLFATNHAALDAAGLIPSFLDDTDPAPARTQFDQKYVGGWRPFLGHEFDPYTGYLHYPEDPPLEPLCVIGFRDELIYIYPFAWVTIVQPDGSYETARMD